MEILERHIQESAQITLDEAKSWIRVTHKYDDSLIAGLIKSAYYLFEEYADMTLLKSIYTVRFEKDDYYKLPRGPISGVLTVARPDGSFVTEYVFDGVDTLYIESVDDVEYYDITYEADSAEDPGIHLILLQILAAIYEKRGIAEPADISDIKGLHKYKRKLWF